jgi:hypothetical protein
MTPEQAAAERVTKVLTERDAIQSNLLELDGSFTKRVLDGATLTGQTRDRWATASAALANLWETFLAYSAVVDRVAALGSGNRRPARKDLPELTALLEGGCLQLPDAQVPLARRDLAATGRPPVTLAAAVTAMRTAFTGVARVTSQIEAVWTAVGVPFDAATAELARCRPLVSGLGQDIEADFRAAEADLQAQRDAANADPLALWRPGQGSAGASTGAAGQADTSAAERLRAQVAQLSARITELDRVRRQARARIDALAAAATAARAARQEAVGAWRETSVRVGPLPPLPPDLADAPLAGLSTLASRGQWRQLETELGRCEAELARFGRETDELRGSASAALNQRDELRGLLRAYKAKAARLGAAEDANVAARYDEAHALLWTAPCDLAVAQAAVATYQRAILATEGQR